VATRAFSALSGRASSIARRQRFFQWRLLMRLIVLGVCVFAAACSGQSLNSVTSPTSASVGLAQTQAQSGTDLPFRGSFTSVTELVPPDPHARATLTGTASNVGRFVAIFTGIVDSSTNSAAGTFTVTAANGDQLSGTWTGVGEVVGPGVVKLTEDAIITNGTGRFAGASGAFTIVRVESIGATGSAGNGTLDGHIDLNH
jgi:hypothetical protein